MEEQRGEKKAENQNATQKQKQKNRKRKILQCMANIYFL